MLALTCAGADTATILRRRRWLLRFVALVGKTGAMTKDKQPIAFVTNDTRDFSKGKLHEHLAVDLRQIGLAQDVITVFQLSLN